MKTTAFFLGIILWAVSLVQPVRAEEPLPAKPGRYFNDSTLSVSSDTAERLNKKLEDFEKETSNQILAVIYPRLQSDSSADDYAQRVARSWQVGQKDRNNGAVLFVFLENRKITIATGYGLEGVLPDAVCKQITADVIAPKFKAGDIDGGMTAGLDAMIQAAKGEYRGSGTTVAGRENQSGAGEGGLSFGTILFLLIAAYFLFSLFRNRSRGGTMFTGGGPVFFPMGFGGFGGGSSGGGGGGNSGSSDGGGFFSSGGGDFGRGGASSDW